MARVMKRATAVTLIATAITLTCNFLCPSDFLFSLGITLGTISYHFVIRLFIGLLVSLIMHNHADYFKPRYHVSDRELRFYERIGIRQWKCKLPSFDPDLFDRRKHSWDEIAQAMCQAEIIHETIAVFSFLPILLGFRFGAWPVFIVTSLIAACIDLLFVALQRYNRPRIVQLVQMLRQRRNNS